MWWKAGRVPLVVLILVFVPVSVLGQLSVSTSQLVARGVTPRANVLFFGVSMQPLGYESRIIRSLAIVADNDGDGVVSYSPQRLDIRSVWFAVDIQSGKLFSVAPAGSPAKIIDLNRVVAGAPAAGGTRFTRRFSSFLEVVLVRPSQDVWALTAGDGGPGDDDRTPDNSVSVAFARFIAVPRNGKPATPPPQALAGGDVLIAIEPWTLKAYTLTLALPQH